MSIKSAAQVAFEAYSKAVGGLNVAGAEIPAWENLPEKVRIGWRCATGAAVGHVVSHGLNGDPLKGDGGFEWVAFAGAIHDRGGR